MNRSLLFFLLVFSACAFGQEKAQKLGFHASLDANIGLDLADIIRTRQAKSDYEISQLPPGKFNYGFSAMAGYQPLSWLSLNGGLRYSYIDPNFHLIYYKIQPNFYLGDPNDEDFLYLFTNFGMKINETAAQKAGFFGIGVGKIEPLSTRFGHQFQAHLDIQGIDDEALVFVGLSYGITLFSNKNL